MSFHVPARYRLTHGPYASNAGDGNNGMFIFNGPLNRELRALASDGMGWEHVSVSMPKTTPNWIEMCFVKDLFWDDEDVVMQLHPRRSDYVNFHQHCLHLWRPNDGITAIPLPPFILVGPKQESDQNK